MKKRAVAGVLVVLAGMLVAAYPWLKAAYFEYSKNMALSQWEQMDVPGETPTQAETRGAAADSHEQLAEEVWEEDTDAPFDAAYVIENMEGVITIDKINLRYPILRNATKYNLNFAICAVAGSPEIGEPGNYCLAGHKSRIYGRQFNRLTELQTGDSVYLFNGEKDFEYVVTEILQINPEDTWVLEDEAGKKLLTLITCDYTVAPIGRFIVKCELAG